MHKRYFFLGLVLTGTIFLTDLLMPAGLHLEFLYTLVILLSIRVPGVRSTFDAAIVMTGLIAAGYFLNHKSAADENVVASLVIPTACIWAFYDVITRFKKEQEKSMHSNEYLRSMFENATEGMLISNMKGVIIMVNPHAEQMFGYENGELLNSKIEQLVPERFAHKHVGHRQGYYKEMKTRPMGQGMSLHGRKKDGTEFPVEISLSHFRIHDEAFVISFIIDITDRKKQEDQIARHNEELEQRVASRTRELAETNATLKEEMDERSKIEEALRDSERLYSTIAHNFPNGWIVVLDRDLRRVFIDGKELQELGIRRENYLGTTVEEKTLLPVNDDIREKLNKVFEWQSASFDVEYQGKTYEVNAVPLPDMKGFVKEILLVIQNVTGVREAEKDIRQSLEKERQLNELKSKFVSIASHEFRTPLSTILSSVSLAEKYAESGEDEKRARHFERIKSSVRNLTGILNDFLSLEKLEAGKVEYHPSRFDLVEFAEDLQEEMQALARPGQDIRYVHDSEEKEVYLDKNLLRNICFNLLNNAIKYSPEDRPIEFTTAVGPEVRLSVKDHGLGIPAADQQHLFERFFRARNVTAIQGTGLGLNIVNRYARLMDGRIDFRSRENEGSEFTVVFRRHQPTE